MVVPVLITAGVLVAILALVSKNFALLLLALPIFIFGGIAINFISIPWYVWTLALVVFVYFIVKNK